VRDGWLKRDRIDPADFGFPAHKPGDVVVSGRDEAVDTLRGLLAGVGPQAMLDMLALNLGAALHLLEESPLTAAMDKARAAVAAGLAAKAFGDAHA